MRNVSVSAEPVCIFGTCVYVWNLSVCVDTLYVWNLFVLVHMEPGCVYCTCMWNLSVNGNLYICLEHICMCEIYL